ncbi:MAG: CYTH domain-containing protein [Magnetococcales bacterium]|nr:CYTH domain-containing protein [Magnetococcales bacterium]NGZ06227.1 CYTH domain-containing protein [Magnetococcales bacterium]
MGTEIERRFLVKNDGWRGLAEGVDFQQGFLSTVKERVVRVRIAGDKATLTIKGVSEGFSRLEFEYAIPKEEALIILNQVCERPWIEKTRHRIPVGQLVWEVDEFRGANQGLIMAEVELTDERQQIELPSWIGREVSTDPRFFNANLVHAPFSVWGQGESFE